MKENEMSHKKLKISSSIRKETIEMNEVDALRVKFGIDKIMGANSMLDLIQKELKLRQHAMAS
jgi:hypothetical protein